MIKVKRKLHISKENRGRKRLSDKPSVLDTVEPGRIPRISKLMALAIYFDDLLAKGEVKDMSELAQLAGVTQPRISQIMNLTLLAPDIQEWLLFLPRVTQGKDAVTEKQLRPVAADMRWTRQCGLFKDLNSDVIKRCETAHRIRGSVRPNSSGTDKKTSFSNPVCSVRCKRP